MSDDLDPDSKRILRRRREIFHTQIVVYVIAVLAIVLSFVMGISK